MRTHLDVVWVAEAADTHCHGRRSLRCSMGVSAVTRTCAASLVWKNMESIVPNQVADGLMAAPS